ncbi:MAG: RNA pseudouridine synthase [Planctomycetaceae bacterium]|nr:RNA pseudouridine synthase [Planctomycetaceae bacterium]
MHVNGSQAESYPPLVELEDLAVFAKPPGMETISQTGGREFAALVRAARDEPGLTPVHRLDRDTSGAVLFARNGEAEQALIDLFRRRLTRKLYLALCLGAPRNRTGRINRNLSEWGGGRRPVRVLKQGGLEASTGYRVLAASDEWAPGLRLGVVAFSPHQGRTHQIRVHAAALGYPVLGDDQYGDRTANRAARERFGLRRSALHAWRLEFPWRGGNVAATAPVPDDMLAAARATLGEKIVAIGQIFTPGEDIF